MLLIALFATLAAAQDAVTLSAVRTAQVGATPPELRFDVTVDSHLQADLSCAGRSFAAAADLREGERMVLALPGLPEGQHSCRGTLRLTEPSGAFGEMPLSLQVALLAPLGLSVDRSSLDLSAHTLTLEASRPLASIKVSVTGPRGVALGGADLGGDGLSTVPLEWSQQDGEVVKITLDATDTDGMAARLELLPWSYAIPHEDVVFASGSHSIDPSEVAKLEAAYTELTAVLETYGDVVDVRLYVAGYTDTVGDAAANLALSGRRATAIAVWFRERGFTGPVAWQGFGERAQAVATADGVDQAANRRAVYLLAAEAPSLSADIPASRWTKL